MIMENHVVRNNNKRAKWMESHYPEKSNWPEVTTMCASSESMRLPQGSQFGAPHQTVTDSAKGMKKM